ncbi:hypothetical protein [Kaarinaea lacus]
MRSSGFIAIFMFTIAPGLIGCTIVHNQNYSQQNQWLASNYPDRASHLNQISSAQPYFRDDVIAGQVQLGMTVDEVLIATDTTPFGPKRYKGKFWCDNKTVDRCDANCQRCDGMIFFQNQLIWFRGHDQPPTVVDMDQPTHHKSIFASAPSKKFQIAEALYRNEIIPGMSFSDVNRVLSSIPSKARYFCDNNQAQALATCDASCAICKIKIPAQNANAFSQVIFLEPYLGEHRVIRIEQ